jgi:transcriptional regulator with XRE-family HTH domain
MEIGTQLRKLRDQQKKTTRDMAAEIGVSQSTYTDWELDKSSPSLKNYFKIAEAFEITPVKLMSYLAGNTLNVLPDQKIEIAVLTEKVETLSQYTLLLGNENKLIRNELKNMMNLIINKRVNF